MDSSDRIHFVAATSDRVAHCELCGDLVGRTIGFYAAIVAGMLVALAVGVWIWYKLPLPFVQRMERYLHAATPETKLKIIVGFLMTLTRVHDVYDVSLPPNVQQLLSHLNITISIGLDSVSTQLMCMGFTSYGTRLVFWMLVPPIVVGAIILGSLARLLYENRRLSAHLLLCLS
jgi:hypothetical protein